MPYRLQIKRGLKGNLPAHAAEGEPLVTLDTGEFYLGRGPDQPLLQIHRPSNTKSTTAPLNPMLGDLWWNPNTNETKMWNGSSWDLTATTNHTFAQDNMPLSGMFPGDFWIQTPQNILHRYDGSQWLAYRDQGIQAALDAAAAASETADGKIQSFWQAHPPVAGMDEGDLWFETDNGNLVHRYTSGAWVNAQDSQIGAAIAAASTAQATADGKVTTYFGTSAPTGTMSLGDLWYNAVANELKRWNGSTWTVVSTINHVFAQSVPPTSESGMVVGDLWIDTSNGNKLYRYNGTSWISVQDTGIQKAIDDAALAKGTAQNAMTAIGDIGADGKITAIEKQKALVEWQTIQSEAAPGCDIPTQATLFGVSSTNFVNAYNALDAYLNTTLQVFSSMATTTDLAGKGSSRTQWNSKWQTYYNQRTYILNQIASRAKTLADTAQGTANTAQGIAQAAKDYVDGLAADGKITTYEKKQAKKEWTAIVKEGKPSAPSQGTLVAQATALSVSTTSFVSAYNALDTYLNTTLTVFTDMASMLDLAAKGSSRDEWNSKWNGYYDARTVLVNAIIASRADAAIVTTQGNRITNAEQSISTLQGTITQKADATTVNALSTRVGTAEVSISGLQSSITQKAESSIVSALSTRVGTAEVNISGLQSSITAKAESSVVTDLSSRVGTAEVNISGLQSSITAKADVTYVDSVQNRTTTLETELAITATGWSLQTDSNGYVTGVQAVTYPTWYNYVPYKVGAIVRVGSRYYKALNDSTGHYPLGYASDWAEVSSLARSEMTVLVDRFKIANPGNTSSVPFSVTTHPVSGASMIAMTGTVKMGDDVVADADGLSIALSSAYKTKNSLKWMAGSTKATDIYGVNLSSELRQHVTVDGATLGKAGTLRQQTTAASGQVSKHELWATNGTTASITLSHDGTTRTCAIVADAFTLNGNAVVHAGNVGSYAATIGHNHDAAYLGISAQAVDSAKLGGVVASGYATSGHNHDSAYVRLGVAGTITAVHSFSPGAVGAPFTLGTNAQGQLVTGLNADKLDGNDASAFALAGHNHSGTYLGISATAADSSKLGGVSASGYAASGHNHDAAYLGISAQATDSAKLNGQAASYYAKASDLSGYLPTGGTAADSSKLGGVAAASFLQRTSANRPGVIKLYQSDGDGAYNVQARFSGQFMALSCFNGDSSLCGCSVAYATDAGSAGEAVSASNSQFLQGNSPGNLANNVPLNNGTVCVNLNADLLDGYEASAFSLSGHGHSVATVAADGFLSSTDKVKLNGIETGAQVNQSAWSRILVDGTTYVDSTGAVAVLKLNGGANITLTPDNATRTISIAATGLALSGHNHDAAYLGISSQAADSAKLNGQAASYYATAAALSGYATSGHNHDSAYVRLGVAGTITAAHTFNPGTAGPAFALGANASGQLITGLNADKLDGNDASVFATAASLSGYLTTGGTAYDSSRLGGVAASGYATSGHNHSGVYLPVAGTAADSSKLNGQAASYYATAASLSGYLTTGGTAYDSSRLGGTAASGYALSGHTHTGVYLPVAGVAADSSKLNGQLPSYYATAASLSGYLTTGGTAADSSKLGGVAASGYSLSGHTHWTRQSAIGAPGTAASSLTCSFGNTGTSLQQIVNQTDWNNNTGLLNSNFRKLTDQINNLLTETGNLRSAVNSIRAALTATGITS